MMIAAFLALPGVFAASADDLDAALEARKRAVQRRVYTDSALIQDQGLTLPKTPSQMEQEAEKKIRDSEQQLNATAVSRPTPVRPAPVAAPAQNKNWLVPETGQQDAEDEGGSQWSDFSPARLHDADRIFGSSEAADDETRIQRMVQERLQQPAQTPSSLQSDPAGIYASPWSAAPPSRPDTPFSLPLYSSPAQPFRPIATPSPSLQGQRETSGFRLPAPSAAISAPSFSDRTYQPSPALSPNMNFQTQRGDPMDSMYERRTIPSPLDQIRQSSPVRKRDPFTDSGMPEFRQSIWE